MKYLKNRRVTVLIFCTVLLIALSFISCDELITNKHQEKKKTEQTNQTISTNKNEAKLLLMLSKDNQDVIKLSKALQHIISKAPNVALAKKIEQTHLEIAEDFHEVASDKLISIPNYSEITIKQPLDSDTQEYKIKTLKKLESKIDNQLFLLDKLSKTTNSPDFKTLIGKADSKIEETLKKTKRIINNLITNS
ncbi:hypothetical protein [Olleya sp. HaHaR_3_96]|uniref:hypothetical protein n=1 Tax=Olleya sp. HaHaR_3_96 TaxID=2745560 RepID=UPI001C4E4A87|nr:hypothetical protein [Olleya sp. HaHaR_3_96]QXP60797.1 hypothetical protein H0I26_03930 [Olleya sp. HaHaR_3_96]